jgi:hypothetical protein
MALRACYEFEFLNCTVKSLGQVGSASNDLLHSWGVVKITAPALCAGV